MGTTASGLLRGCLTAPGALVLAAFALAGCVDNLPGSYTQAEYQADPSQLQHDIYFQPGSAKLANGERERLNTALRNLLLRPDDDILVHLASTGSEVLDAQRVATARSAVSGTRARVRIVAPSGFNLVDPYPDVGLVQVMRYSRVIVKCPNQGADFNDDAFRRSELLMGCVNAANIANMADEKRDLTAPGEMEGTDRFTGLAAVERYREDRVKQPAVDSISE